MFFLYQFIISVLLIISPIIILVRVIKGKEDIYRFLEKFSIPKQKRAKGKIIWFHGASVGEIKSIIPLLEKFQKNKGSGTGKDYFIAILRGLLIFQPIFTCYMAMESCWHLDFTSFVLFS